MYDLFTFYRGREWRSLLEQLKIERVNDDGVIICEHCGKPITKAYDIIGHHKEELTEENVNDFNISLNPNNIAFVHHRCHNLIHNKLGYAVRNVFIVYGPPFAGKNTWVNDNRNDGDIIVNMDSIWQAISGCDRYTKPNRLKAVAFRIRDDLIDAVKYRLGRWANAYIVGGYPLQSERERLTKELQAKEVYIEADEETCIARLHQEERCQDVAAYEGYIRDWFRQYTPPHEGTK